jgi:hypothetical protein
MSDSYPCDPAQAGTLNQKLIFAEEENSNLKYLFLQLMRERKKEAEISTERECERDSD